ncbi:membrane protein [Sphingomonas melonis]|uniref:Membrane protein n=1 Tax=Sphingomonas melonis TaxID=152682 RepID=A0A0D1JXT2_9SPHN|nr:hypothetical protein [Sphingomonas melonis]KIU26018.1 membrane protein [Sphingomonas melonis]
MLKKVVFAIATTSLVAAPALARPNPAANPAASLSVAKSLRVGHAGGKHGNDLAGGGLIVAVIAAAAVVAGVVVIADSGNNSASN